MLVLEANLGFTTATYNSLIMFTVKIEERGPEIKLKK